MNCKNVFESGKPHPVDTTKAYTVDKDGLPICSGCAQPMWDAKDEYTMHCLAERDKANGWKCR